MAVGEVGSLWWLLRMNAVHDYIGITPYLLDFGECFSLKPKPNNRTEVSLASRFNALSM
jgi:hypothetical protein